MRNLAVKMFRDLAFIYLLLGASWLSIVCASKCKVGENHRFSENDPIEGEIVENDPDSGRVLNPVEVAILEFEKNVANLTDHSTGGVSSLSDKEMEELADVALPALENIVNLLKDDPNNVYKFIEAKGINRVIVPYIPADNIDLRALLLKLTQMLFDSAPTTASLTVPVTLLDKLLDIYEDDDNLLVKTRIMNILYAWLPGNPVLQGRVMKLKGLDPFYEQAHKLDAKVMYVQLKLFSQIIKEHVRNHWRDIAYKKTGLIERLSTNRVGHGIFNIFQALWSHQDQINEEMLVLMFEIIADIQPYCAKTLIRRPRAIEFITDLYKYVKEADEATKDRYKKLGLNFTNFEVALQFYVDKLQASLKDEL